MTVDIAYRYIYMFVIIFLSLALFACLIRAIRGPRIADRIVAVNMMGTMVMVIMTVLSLLLDESYLVDISLITKVYIGIYEERKAAKERLEGEE